MIRLKNTKVSTYDLSSLTISWEYEVFSPDDDPETSYITIYKTGSESLQDKIVLVSGLKASDYYEYTDTNVSGLVTYRYNEVNYVIHINNTDGSLTKSDLIHHTIPISIKTKNIIRKKNNILRLHGQTFYLLKRKRFGQESANYDSLLGAPLKAVDSDGYLTPFDGGYYTPISFKAMITTLTKQAQVNMLGEINPGNLTISLTSYPKLSTEDVIVDQLNKRWYVSRVNLTSRDGYIIAQDALLTLINTSSTIYNIEVN